MTDHDQLPGLPNRSWREWVADTIGDASVVSAPRTTEQLMRIIPNQYLQDAAKAGVLNAVGKVCRDRGLAATSGDADEGKVYQRPEQMTLPGIVEFIRSQQALVNGIQVRTIAAAQAWVDAHPDTGLEVSDLFERADEVTA